MLHYLCSRRLLFFVLANHFLFLLLVLYVVIQKVYVKTRLQTHTLFLNIIQLIGLSKQVDTNKVKVLDQLLNKSRVRLSWIKI